ncbi:MAG: hypothetical protein NPIRA03_27050 [Nitrospirales bacterium]|nr:MAG: hypothetical protein NPIRA03_27050 [Nitrospirales bacterium]
MKTTEKPPMNHHDLHMIVMRILWGADASRSWLMESPVIYERKDGTKGSTQGETTDKSMAPNAPGKVT